jgi:hypothetical protein
MRPIAFICALLAALFVPAAPSLAADWEWPVSGEVVTQFRNVDDPYAAGQHRGVDIAAPVGTTVRAAAAGTVVFAGVVGSSGLVVSERTADGRYELSYLHLSAASVRRGDAVDGGDAVGLVGTSGSRSVDQPHLHFGVREAADRHAYVDPLTFLRVPPRNAPPQPRAVPVPARAPVAAAPAPVPAPLGAPAPVAAPGLGHVAPHPAALPHGRPLAAGPRAAVAPPAAHLVHPGLAREPRRGPLPHAPATRAAVHAPGHGPAAGRERTPGVPHVARAAAHAAHAHGIDRGWLAACAGLVLAAALLAAPGGTARRGRSARATFGALIRAASRA